MKRYSDLAAAVIVALLALCCRAGADSLVVNLDFEPSSLQLQTCTGGDGESYTRVTLQDCHETTDETGKPELPAKTVRILLPPGAVAQDVSASSKTPVRMGLTHAAYPKQPPYPTSIDHPQIPWVSPEPATYTANSPYPGYRVYWRRQHDHIGNYSITEITVYPVDYVGATSEIILHSQIEITIEYAPNAANPLPVVRRSKLASQAMRSYVASIVANPEILSQYLDPPSDNNVVDFAIITRFDTQAPDPSRTEWERLADWKTKRGVVTRLYSTDWISANFSGVDLAERIRNFIKHAYTNLGTIYVLLGGDTDVIPDRKAHNAPGGWGPTDLYYSALEGNWNANGNAQFGEFDDQCDETADLFLGRAPVNTWSEVKSFVDKVITYEQTAGNIPPYVLDYPANALLMGATIYGWPWGQNLNNFIASNYIPSQWNVWKLYAPVEPGGNEWLSRTSATRRLSQGWHLVNHADHSAPYAMGTGIDHNDWWERLISRRDVDLLTNQNLQSIVFSLGCSPNAFDMDSISEHFINNPKGGAVGYIGNTRVGYTYQEYQSYKFFESLFINNLYNLGRAFASILYGGSFARRSMNLLGDPEMPVWTAKPRALAVVLPENITTKPTDVTAYVVDASGMPPWPPVADALVTFSKGDEVYVSAVTNINGQARVHIYPETPGNISVVASKQNYTPASDVLPVIASAEPALSYANHRIDDDQIGGSYGNSNGSADAGETIELPVALKNFGNSTAYLVSARLSSDSPYITIIDAEERWPDITSGEKVWCEEDFDFVVAPDTPDGTTVTFQLDISSILPDGRPLSWSDTFQITIHAAILTHVGHKVNDTTGGNGNGVLEPKETAEIPVLVRNSGGTEVNFAMAELESLSTGIEIVQSTAHFHNLSPRSERWNCPFVNFVIRTTADYSPGDMVRFTIRDDLGRIFHSDFDFKRIGPPSNLQLIPGQGCMELRWSKVSDALGYHVYRRLEGETDFVRVDDELLTTATLFVDYNLPAGKLCEYRVTAVNSTYNESTLWTEASGYTNPAFASGWPREVGSNGFEGSSPAVGNVYGSGEQVVICATDNYVYVWNRDGSLVPGWPKPVPMPSSGTPAMNNASPALANLDDDPQLEIVVAAGRYVYAWNGDGTNLPGWPQEIAGATMASASIGDIDRDGAPEIIASSASPPYVYAWNPDGSPVPGWPVTILYPEDWIRTAAALADVDADGYPEVIVGTLDTAYVQSEVYVWKGSGQLLPYWPQSVDFVIWSAPVVGDIDGDCRNEIIVANMQNRIYAWHGDGTPQEGNWPANVGSSVANACALADLDGDGTLEILAGLGSGYITALRHDGTPLAGWPVYTEQGPVNSPSVADLDSDGSQEIVVPNGDYDGHLHVLRADGSRFPGSPYVTGGGMTSAPTIADLDGPISPDPPKAEIAIGALDRLMYIWSLPWRYDPANAQWPTFMHDFRRTGSYGPDRTGQPVPIDRIMTVKYFPDGAWVRISCKVVTAGTLDFAGAFYVEEPDRSSGIRVEPIDLAVEPISRWQIVSVTGYLATVGGERAIVNATVELCGGIKMLRPLAMSNLRLGGGPVGRFTLGVYPSGTGPNNVGLLVTSYGRVTWVSPDRKSFYIDDGSELQDGSGHKGVCVSLEGLADGNVIVPPHVGAYVSVTGISSCGYEYSPVEQPVRILKPRSQEDIRVYSED